MAAELARKRRSRGGYIAFINKIVKGELADIYNNYEESHLVKLESFKVILEEKLNVILKLNDEIQSTLEEEAEFQADFDKYADIEVSIRHDIASLTKFISDKKSAQKTVTQCESKIGASNLKLPKFVIKKFNGDPVNWKS